MNTFKLASLAGTAILLLGIAPQATYAQEDGTHQINQDWADLPAEYDGMVQVDNTIYLADAETIERKLDVPAKLTVTATTSATTRNAE
jgi:hypothetical protein